MHGIYAFLLSQLSTIQPGVYDVRYPDIQYRRLVPVVPTGDEWAGTIVHFSSDMTGKADWIGPDPTAMPLVDDTMQKHVVTIENAGIGYRYGLQELRQSQRLGIAIDGRRAKTSFRKSEELLDRVVLDGVPDFRTKEGNWESLIKSPLVGVGNLAPSGDGGDDAAKRLWANKGGGDIVDDVNEAIDHVWINTRTVEMPNTLGLPPGAIRSLIAKRIPNTAMTGLEFLKENNLYTQQTGGELMIETIRDLDKAGVGGVGRMIVYPRDENALRLHQVMAYDTLPPFQDHPMSWLVHGFLRTGGLEIMIPKALVYRDGITPAPA